jgi:ribosome-binding factor A
MKSLIYNRSFDLPMAIDRTVRLNSLLKEVISEVIKRDVHNPHVNTLMTVTQVEITKDLHHAKVYISVIGTPEQKQETIKALQSAAGFIAVQSSKKVVMRYFPELTFKLDNSVEKQATIDNILVKIRNEQRERQVPPSEGIDETDL